MLAGKERVEKGILKPHLAYELTLAAITTSFKL